MPRVENIGSGGAGFSVGLAPNLFGSAAGDLAQNIRTVTAAASRAAAEALRDGYDQRAELQALTWKAKSNTLNATNIDIYSEETTTSAPWGSGSAWVMPGNTKITVTSSGTTTTYTTSANRTARFGTTSYTGSVMFDNIPCSPNIAVAISNGTALTVAIPLGNWRGIYEMSPTLSIVLMFTSGGVTQIIPQNYVGGAWRDVALFRGIPGVAGSRANYSGIGTNVFPKIDSSSTPTTSLLIDDGGTLKWNSEAVAVDSDLFSGNYNDLSNKPTIPDSSDIQSEANKAIAAEVTKLEGTSTTEKRLWTTEELQDLVGAMVTGNTETNMTVTYDDTNGKLNFVASGTASTTPTASITSLALTGVTSPYSSATDLPNPLVFTFAVDHPSNVQGNLTLETRLSTASTYTSLASNIAASATTTSITLTTAHQIPANAIRYYKLSGTDTSGNGFSREIAISAIVASDYMYWGTSANNTPASVSYTDFNTAATRRTTLVGDIHIPQWTGNKYFVILVPSTFADIKDIRLSAFSVKNAFVHTEDAVTINNVKFDTWITASPQSSGSYTNGVIYTIS
jgi:hypothetical protein